MEPRTVGLPDRRVGAGRMQGGGDGLRGVRLVSGLRIHGYGYAPMRFLLEHHVRHQDESVARRKLDREPTGVW